MTQIKIPFTKKAIQSISADKLDPGAKGLEVEIETNYYMSSLVGSLEHCHGGTPDNTFQKMVFIFQDNTEADIYSSLLDSNQTQFELSFEKEKVYLEVGGFGNFIDTTKPKIEVYPAPASRMMVIFFDPKFTGIISLTKKENQPERERRE